jgi:hypothetical protein
MERMCLCVCLSVCHHLRQKDKTNSCRERREEEKGKNESKVVAGERATSSLRLLTKTDAKLRYRVSLAVVVVAGNSINFAT